MRVFLTGATGYIGRALSERLRAAGTGGAIGRGVRTVVIRPAIVFGRGGGIPAGFVESACQEGAARYVGTGENRSGQRARELLGWRPHRQDVLEDMEHGSYVTGGRG
jgi:hypothetical protein